MSEIGQAHFPPKGRIRLLTDQITGNDRAFPRAWGRRDTWQVRLRWWVPPAILLGVLIGRWTGFEVDVVPVLLVAAFVLLYNVVFAVLFRRSGKESAEKASVDRLYAILQVSLDYVSMFLLIHYTGGAASPLIFFFILHVIIAAILFRPGKSWLFAGIATVGMMILALAESMGWLVQHPVSYRGEADNFNESSAHVGALLVFFAASVFVTAALTTAIMRRLRRRVRDLAETTGEVASLNDKLNSLYAMLSTVGSERTLSRILDVVTSELAAVMDVAGVAVKLLSEDGRTLRFAAAHGLPGKFSEEKTVEVAKSPLNRRIIEGETLVFGQVAEDKTFQLLEDLQAAGIRSVVFAPLRLEDRVIGILGAYCRKPDRFGSDDAGFLRIAAELIAVAIENARAYEAVESSMRERSQFMLRVAHNMRAPLTATMSMLHVLQEGYLGELDAKKQEHLKRVDRRLDTLNRTVGELLMLAHNREGTVVVERRLVDVGSIAARVGATFMDEASRQKLEFRVRIADVLPRITGDPAMMEQMLENLVSNAIKYTPSGGSVDFAVERSDEGQLRIEVRDTGIGVPTEEQSELFSEFFRASNAKKMAEDGTGLGLAIVKQIVDMHAGHIRVNSREGEGTSFIIELPVGQS